MFNNPPRIFAHVKSVEDHNYVLHDYILNKSIDPSEVNLFHRFCPHRMYPMHSPGEHTDEIYCKFHNFKWKKDGEPINNTKKVRCGKATVGRTGLIFKNFIEPDHKWVDDLSKETELRYSHCFTGKSAGSWLWLMDAEADLLHVHMQGIHPFLAQQVSLDDIKTDQGDGWIYQEHPDGWWVYIYPYTFIEYGRPGCVMVNTVIPNDPNSEYGFEWITQFYYADHVNANTRMIFETLETVFREDVGAAELQKGDYFPLKKPMNEYENHCVHWGDWVTKNKEKP